MKGFHYAINGLKTAFVSELNLKTHTIATFLVVMAGWYFEITRMEWIVVVMAIGMVISIELINTAIEYFVDFISPEIHPAAGKIKDISAGAVLVAAIAACITGLIIFLPKIFDLLN
ncbi:MAG: diacylglycerol kinase family protein [Bacteroidota bacterium]|nr:diacylglycerol kinase family protein [Bacteroidota bacterium]